MQLLVALAKVRPNVVSRDRLVEQCWNGRVVGDDALNRCILALRHLAREFSPQPFEIETLPRVGYRMIEDGSVAQPQAGFLRHATLLGAAAAALLIIGAVVFGAWTVRQQLRRPSAPTILVAAATDDPGSRTLTHDLAVQLNMLETGGPGTLRLIGDGAGADADLVLQVRQIAEGANTSADVLLKRGRHGAILWSSEFSGASRNPADLKQQIAYAAAQVLGCALDAARVRQRIRDQAFQNYLTACAVLADLSTDSRDVVRLLRDVVRAAPDFGGGWAKLLYAERQALNLGGSPEETAALRSALAQDLESARRIKPDLAEVYIARAALLPPADFIARSRLLDAAVARDPDYAQARSERSRFLESVGLTEDAVLEARRAVMLDPLSPATREDYIIELAFAGRMDAARAALTDAERLWPGAKSLTEARYNMNLRAGDPAEALRLLRSGAVTFPAEALQWQFLEARAHRTPREIEAVLLQGRRALQTYPDAIQHQAQALAEFGRDEELIGILLNWRRMDLVDILAGILFRPAFADLHKDRRFIQVADRLGLLTYWRKTDRWPDFCFEPDLPYDCKVEAAKLGRG
jgi:tetratricopeptide (TPR) repeat protein